MHARDTKIALILESILIHSDGSRSMECKPRCFNLKLFTSDGCTVAMRRSIGPLGIIKACQSHAARIDFLLRSNRAPRRLVMNTLLSYPCVEVTENVAYLCSVHDSQRSSDLIARSFALPTCIDIIDGLQQRDSVRKKLYVSTI